MDSAHSFINVFTSATVDFIFSVACANAFPSLMMSPYLSFKKSKAVSAFIMPNAASKSVQRVETVLSSSKNFSLDFSLKIASITSIKS